MDWRGPYQVIQRHKGEYELRDPALSEPLFISEHLLEPYHVDHDHSTPIEVAIQDRNMSIIEAVLDVEGNSYAPRNRLKLLIKWADEVEPRWMQWNRTFSQNRLCHEFFWQKGRHWRTLIPAKFLQQYHAAAGQPVQVGAIPRRREPRVNPNPQPRHYRGRLREIPREPDSLPQATTTRLGRVVRRPEQPDV
jgi:hypothetical protein